MAKNVTPERPSAGQEQAIAILAAGGTVSAAAEAAGVARKTVYRWMKTDAVFVAALNEARDAVADQLRADRDALAGEAVAALRDLLKADTPPAIRLRAAVGVLEVFGKPAVPLVGPTEPEAVQAAWKAEEELREQERRKAERWAWVDEIGLPANIG